MNDLLIRTDINLTVTCPLIKANQYVSINVTKSRDSYHVSFNINVPQFTQIKQNL